MFVMENTFGRLPCSDSWDITNLFGSVSESILEFKLLLGSLALILFRISNLLLSFYEVLLKWTLKNIRNYQIAPQTAQALSYYPYTMRDSSCEDVGLPPR